MLKHFDIRKHRTSVILLTLLMAVFLATAGLVYLQIQQLGPKEVPTPQQVIQEVQNDPTEPQLAAEEVVGGLANPWDVAFLPDGALLVNERSGRLSKVQNGQKTLVADIQDVYAAGEGGLTGLALDTHFERNRYIYTCYNAQTASGLDVRLVRWRLNDAATAISERHDIITGIPSGRSGRHSGCRVQSDKEGNLWVGTGDAAVASVPQDPKSLGGKILHVTRDGMPAGNNLPAPFDPRIFSYGHRNVQGIALFDEPRDGVYGYSVEHGSDKDDEVNLIKSGNFGWAPRITYVERGVSMTDTARFPDAVGAVWSSGSPTIAPSGAAILTGKSWGTWEGSVAMAVLKAKHLRILQFDQQHQVVGEKQFYVGEYGRIRSANIGLDGNLYLTTDNGSGDRIIKVIPTS